MNPRPTSLYGDIIARIAETRPGVVAGLTVPTGEEVSFSHIVWVDGQENKIDEEDFLEAVAYAKALSYREDRVNAYPPIEEQLDMIYHGGIEAWRETIAAVKSQFPKPTDV